MPLTPVQASAMLDLQDKMNAKVDANWIETRNPFLRAAALESAEAMDHVGWKWWKRQEKDLPQFQMELVDIWHFTLSTLIIDCGGDHGLATEVLCDTGINPAITFDGKVYDIASLSVLEKLELQMGLATVRRYSLPLFFALIEDAEMTLDDLYRKYVAKNVLNFLRQDNGYKSGTYIKEWAGKEDNVHLEEIVGQLDSQSPTFKDDLYAALELRYHELTQSA